MIKLRIKDIYVDSWEVCQPDTVELTIEKTAKFDIDGNGMTDELFVHINKELSKKFGGRKINDFVWELISAE